MPAKSSRAAATVNPALVNSARTAGFLAGAQLHDQPAARRQQAARLRGDGAVTIKPIRAAIERNRRVVVAHFRRERWRYPRARCRAGWTRRDRTGPQRQRRYRRRRSVQRAAKPLRSALARAMSKAAVLMSVPMPVALGNSLSSASSSAPEPVPMSRIRSFSIARHRRATAVERGFDHGFGFRPRHQHGRADLQHQAPELLAPEYARDRLALEPARGERRRSPRSRPASSTRSPFAINSARSSRAHAP